MTVSISTLSIVTPCYREAANVGALVASVNSALTDTDVAWELILVNDGSPDDTWARIAEAAATDERVRGVNLSRNFGKEAAMLAGLRAARGDAVVVMDGDLQHPPALLPELVETARRENADQVIARRTRDGEGWLRRVLSRGYYRVVRRLMDVPLEDGVGDFRLLSRRALDALLQLTEVNRFSKGLFAWIGFPTAYVDYTNVSREQGASSWSLRSLWNYGVDGIIAFNDRPLRLGIHAGLGIVVASFIYLLVLIWRWQVVGVVVPGYLTTLGAIVFMGGIQIVLIGLIGEYIGRIHSEVKQRPVYLVADTLNDPIEQVWLGTDDVSTSTTTTSPIKPVPDSS